MNQYLRYYESKIPKTVNLERFAVETYDRYINYSPADAKKHITVKGKYEPNSGIDIFPLLYAVERMVKQAGIIREKSTYRARLAADWHRRRRRLMEITLYLYGLPKLLNTYGVLMGAWEGVETEKLITSYEYHHPEMMEVLVSEAWLLGEILKPLREEYAPVAEMVLLPQERNTNIFTKPYQLLQHLQKIETGVDVRYQIECDKLTIKAKSEEDFFRGLNTVTMQFLDFLLIKAHKLHNFEGFMVSVDEYMIMRGLLDRKSARIQMKKSIEALFNLTLHFGSKSAGRKKTKMPTVDFRILGAKSEINSRGDFAISFTREYGAYMASVPPMAYFSDLLRIDERRNRFAYSFARKLLEVFNMRVEKQAESIRAGNYEVILGVDTLLGITDLNVDTPHFAQCVRKPFERDLNALAVMGSWEYCHSGGTPAESASNYKKFSELYIKFNFRNYPDQTRRISTGKKAKGVK